MNKVDKNLCPRGTHILVKKKTCDVLAFYYLTFVVLRVRGPIKMKQERILGNFVDFEVSKYMAGYLSNGMLGFI